MEICLLSDYLKNPSIRVEYLFGIKFDFNNMWRKNIFVIG